MVLESSEDLGISEGVWKQVHFVAAEESWMTGTWNRNSIAAQLSFSWNVTQGRFEGGDQSLDSRTRLEHIIVQKIMVTTHVGGSRRWGVCPKDEKCGWISRSAET